MPRTLPFDAAKSHLRQLIEGMVPGEELVLPHKVSRLQLSLGRLAPVGRVSRGRQKARNIGWHLTSTLHSRTLRSTWSDTAS